MLIPMALVSLVLGARARWRNRRSAELDRYFAEAAALLARAGEAELVAETEHWLAEVGREQ